MRRYPKLSFLIYLVAAATFVFTSLSAGQTAHPANPSEPQSPTSERDVAVIQDQLLHLLRVSPTLTEVVARDPSLLSNTEYVTRNNPELARFLQAHPEIAHNPDFYLFNNLHGAHEQPSETLERRLWPEMAVQSSSDVERELISDGLPFLVFLCMLAAILWLIHVLIENRRWGRIFKLQTDVHGKLIERFGTSQEVLTYMGTEAGKRFLEATPIAVGFERQEPVPTSVARVLTPLQIGVVMTMLGLGLILLRHSVPDAASGLLIIGTVVLMPGLGFIISAGITWFLAHRLGLMPQSGAQS